MNKDSKQTLINRDLLDTVILSGEISNLIQMRDMIKFEEYDSFKDQLRRYLIQLIEHLSKATLFYNINYVYIEDVDNQMDINIVLNRLHYHITHLISVIKNKDRSSKQLNKTINSIVYYVKMICLIYNIDHDKIVKQLEDYKL